MRSSARADAIIRKHVQWAALVGLIPFPLGDVVALTAVQVDLLRALGAMYGQSVGGHLGKSLVVSLTGASAARLGASALKAVPGVGGVLAIPAQAALGAASTYAVGQLFKAHFADGGDLEDFDPDQMRDAYERMLDRGRSCLREVLRGSPRGPADDEEPVEDAGKDAAAEGADDSVHRLAETLTRLARLRDAGDLSPEDYERLRRTLLDG